MSLINQYATIGYKVWISYNTTIGQHQYGDYCYIKSWFPDRSEKIEDGNLFIKGIIHNINWHYDNVQFTCKIINKDGSINKTEIYIKDPTRLTLIK